jgi:ligand-binding sensor domain-containing protein/two-component sensor histidine kinase
MFASHHPEAGQIIKKSANPAHDNFFRIRRSWFLYGKNRAPVFTGIKNLIYPMGCASGFLKKLFPGGSSGYAPAALKRIIPFLVGVAALLAGGLRLTAADSLFNVDVWGTADGLPQSSVIALTQTREGYLWLGTLNGLVRFDGNTFTRFTVNNTPALPDNRVVFLYEDSQTNLWVGTDTAGLCVIRNGVIQNFPDAANGDPVVGAFEDDLGKVWFGTKSGRILAASGGRLDPHPTMFPKSLFFLIAHLLVPGKDGVSWLLQNGRVARWRGEKLEKDFGAAPWGNTPVSAATTDVDGNLIVGALNAGIFWLDREGRWQTIPAAHAVLALAWDHEGNLWAGTDGGGLERIRKNLFQAPAAIHPWVAQSLAEEATGGLWVAFNGGGLSHWLTNTVTDYGIGAGGNAWTVLVDQHGQIWAGTRGEGLFRFMAYYFQPMLPAARVGKNIFVLYQTRAGQVWVGGENGLACVDGENWKFFSARDGLPAKPVRALAEDKAGDLWIGTEGGGLCRLHAGKISLVAAPVTDISSLLVDADDVLWVGTSGHGLARFGHGWTRYSTRDGLSTDNIGYLVADPAGNLWIGSYEGISRADKASLNAVAAGTAKIISCRTLLTRECAIGAQPAAIRAPDGRLWFPTTEGLVSVDPAAVHPNPHPPPVIIESVQVDGVELKTDLLGSAWDAEIHLTPDNEQLEIHFAGLNLSAPKGLQSGARFQYKLAGRDKNWTDLGGERVVHIPRLAPGNYVFQVKASNEDGYWNDTGAAIRIQVAPPYWRKPAFLVSAALVGLAGLAGVIYLISTAKLKRQLRAARQKELIERERARIARDLHDQVGANLTQVALLGEMAEADKELPAEVEQHAQQISATARETTRSLDEIVWSLNSANDTLESLANYACKYAQDYFALAGVHFRPELPVLPPTPIPPEVRHHVFLAFKEAVNNVVKHAQAGEARVKLELLPGKFLLVVSDNGRGVGDLAGKQLRNGLKNMRKRLAEIHGDCVIAPNAGGGTVVTFTVPLKFKG